MVLNIFYESTRWARLSIQENSEPLSPYPEFYRIKAEARILRLEAAMLRQQILGDLSGPNCSAPTEGDIQEKLYAVDEQCKKWLLCCDGAQRESVGSIEAPRLRLKAKLSACDEPILFFNKLLPKSFLQHEALVGVSEKNRLFSEIPYFLIFSALESCSEKNDAPYCFILFALFQPLLTRDRVACYPSNQEAPEYRDIVKKCFDFTDKTVRETMSIVDYRLGVDTVGHRVFIYLGSKNMIRLLKLVKPKRAEVGLSSSANKVGLFPKPDASVTSADRDVIAQLDAQVSETAVQKTTCSMS